jgi:hypothetical protein
VSYYAEVDNGIVLRVIVADDPEWVTDTLGGTWVQTADPYAPPTEVTYAGPGMGYADNLPNLFGALWQEPVADPEGNWPYNGGEIVWHEGRLWVNVTEGVPNVWEPGVSGWHDAPTGGIPAWVQPTGSHDAYNIGDRVTHNGQTWTSTVDANVWEPGVFGWDADAE